MDSFEINKIVAAVLLVALLVIGIGKLSDVIFYVEKPEKPGYSIEVEQAVASTSQSTAETIEEKIDIVDIINIPIKLIKNTRLKYNCGDYTQLNQLIVAR